MGIILDVDLKVDPAYLKASAEEIVKAGIVEALGDPSKILKDAVDSVFKMKVDRRGEPSNSYSAEPYIEWLAAKIIKDTVRECMVEIINGRKDEFEKIIKDQISSKSFMKSVSAAFLKALLKTTEETWKMPIDVSFCIPEDY